MDIDTGTGLETKAGIPHDAVVTHGDMMRAFEAFKETNDDIGGLLQTVMLLARGHRLHTCPQQAWVSWHRTMRTFLDLPDNLMIYSGLALGYADEAAPINSWRSPREPVDVFASFSGFER